MKFTSIEASKRKTLTLHRNPHLAIYGHIEVTRWHKILLVMKYFNRSFKDQNPNSSKEQNPSKVWLYPSQLVAKNSSCYGVYFLTSFKDWNTNSSKKPKPSKLWSYQSHLAAKNNKKKKLTWSTSSIAYGNTTMPDNATISSPYILLTYLLWDCREKNPTNEICREKTLQKILWR